MRQIRRRMCLPRFDLTELAARSRSKPSPRTKSASAMRCYWRSCSPTSRRRRSPLASQESIQAAARPSASCSPFAICGSGSSTTFCSSCKPRRSRKRDASLCPRPVPAPTAPSAPATTRCSLPTSRQAGRLCTDPGCYHGQAGRARKADRRRQAEAGTDHHGLRQTAPKAAPVLPRNKYVEIRQDKPKNKKQRDCAGIQDVQVHHRGHRYRGQREGRTFARCAPIPIARCTTPRSSSRPRPMPHSRPSRRSTAARRPSPRQPASAS